MKYSSFRFVLITSLLLSTLSVQAGTNGDNLLGVGSASSALGGTGVAAPPDALGAITANPATLSLLPAGQLTEVDGSLTIFVPHISASVNGLSANSNSNKIYPIPSIGIAGPIDGANGQWRYGLAIYGVSGLGVDYQGTALDTTLAPTPFPLVAGLKTELDLLEIAPAVAYRISPDWTIGLAVDVDYGSLDLGNGARTGFGVGAQPGLTYKATDKLTLGVTYVSPKSITYRGVTDFDGDGTLDNLKLESPQQVKFGLGYDIIPGTLRVATDARWVNWGGADGYKDFGWNDSWVFGLGVQYTVIPDKLTLRGGYDYGNNPVGTDNGFNGTGGNTVNVQGKNVPTYYYETFRLIGFPAIVEQHISLGLEYRVSSNVLVEATYTHAFRNNVTEQGTNLLGNPVTLSSSLSEDSFDLGVRFSF
jgi:long-chain fatty acid transport protein